MENCQIFLYEKNINNFFFKKKKTKKCKFSTYFRQMNIINHIQEKSVYMLL
jgi:hypothetical protein